MIIKKVCANIEIRHVFSHANNQATSHVKPQMACDEIFMNMKNNKVFAV